MKYSIWAVGVLGVAGMAHGATSPAITLNDGGFRFGTGNIMTSYRTSASGGTGTAGVNLGFGHGDASGWTDGSLRSLSQLWWWYRGGGDTRQWGITNQSSYEQLLPNQARLIYSEPSSGGTVPNALRFTFTYTLHGNIASDSALLIVNWSVENLLQTNQSVALFSYSDPNAGALDFNGQNVWSYGSYADRSELRIIAATDTPEIFMTFGALGNLASQNNLWGSSGAGGPSPTFSRNSMAAFNSIYNAAHANGTVSQTMTTTGTSGAAGALEWTFDLAAGATRSGAIYLGYNTIPAPGAAALLGMGGLLATRRRRN